MSSEHRTTPPPSRARSFGGRRRGLGAAGFAGIAVVLLLAAPTGAAHGAVVFRAPFTGFVVNSFPFSVGIGSCAAAHNPVPISWNGSNATIHFRGSEALGNCPGTQVAYSFGEVVLTSPKFATPTTGSGTVGVALTSSFIASGVVHLGNSTSDSAVAYVYVFVEVWDASSSRLTLVASSTTYLFQQSLYATGSFATHQPTTPTAISLPVSFGVLRAYEVQVTVAAEAVVDSTGGGVAAALMDLSGSNGVTVGAITAK